MSAWLYAILALIKATLASATWRYAEPEGAAPPLSLSLPAVTTATAWLVVDEGDNSRLPLGAPRLAVKFWQSPH